MPRSGTSWASQIFDSCPSVRFRLSPLFSYEFKNQLNEKSSRDEWLQLLRKAYNSSNDFMNQTERRTRGQYPIFANKSEKPPVLVVKDTRFHNLTIPMIRELDDLKVIAVVRQRKPVLDRFG